MGPHRLLAYTVTQRTAEMGIRLALGSPSGRVLWLVLREVIGLLLVGSVVGLAGAAALSRSVKSFLFGITAMDPLTYLLAFGATAVVVTAAGYLPARRAARVDPLVALRHE